MMAIIEIAAVVPPESDTHIFNYYKLQHKLQIPIDNVSQQSLYVKQHSIPMLYL